MRAEIAYLTYSHLAHGGAVESDAQRVDSGSRERDDSPCRPSRDSGSTLILALVFLIVGALVIGGISRFAMGGLADSIAFKNARATLYAADATVNTSAWAMRYIPPASTSEPCPASNPALTFNGQSIAVWCQTISSASPTVTRETTFTACPVAAGTSLTGICTNPVLVAVVDYDDNQFSKTAGVVVNACVMSSSYCGYTMTVASWRVQQGY